MSQAESAYNAALKQDYQGKGVNALVVGDPHEMSEEDYEGLAEQYDSEEVDLVAVTGDLATNGAISGSFDPEKYDESYTESIEAFDMLGDELGADVFSDRGNHWLETDLHGIEQDEEEFNEYLGDIGFEGSPEEYFEQKAENIEFIDGESRQVENRDYGLFGGFLKNYVSDIAGDLWNDFFGPEKEELTVIGGGPALSGDLSPEDMEELEIPDLQEIYEQQESLSEEDRESEEQYIQEELGLEELSDEAIQEVTEEQYREIAREVRENEREELTPVAQVYERLLQKQKQEEEIERYSERKETYEELFEEASENVLVLDHFMPDTRDESDIDKVRDGKPIGKDSLRDVIEEYSSGEPGYNVAVAGGHSGGARYEPDVIGADLLKAGEHHVMEARLEDGNVVEAEGHSPEEWGGEAKRKDPSSGGQDQARQMIQRMVDQSSDPQEVKDKIEQEDISDQRKQRLKQIVDEIADEPGQDGGPSPEASGGRAAAGA
jgi:Icc-related predicted phosphoesterase